MGEGRRGEYVAITMGLSESANSRIDRLRCIPGDGDLLPARNAGCFDYFAVLFSCGAAVLLMLYILDRAGQSTMEFLELRAREVLHHARVWRTAPEPRSRI